MSLKAFLKENAIKIESASYAASKRFVDDQGNSVNWKLRILSNTEFDKILLNAQKKVADPGNPRNRVTVVDNTKLRDDLLVACVEYPNLADLELQNSYGAIGELELIKKMLTPGELTDLVTAIQQANGFEVGMEDRVQEAKN